MRFTDEDTSAVARLAREIGVTFRPEDETRAFKVAWVKLLAAIVAKHTWPHFHKYAEDVRAWAGQIEAADGVTLALESVCERVREELHHQDYDDGWATDPASSAIESVTLALLPNTRWMAHAAQHVWRFVTHCHAYNEVTALSEKAWLRHLYEQASIRALSPEPPLLDELRRAVK